MTTATTMVEAGSSEPFERLESEVRSYSRRWPVVFDSASGVWLTDSDGQRYLDLFAGAGTLNYGHNDPTMKAALVDYVQHDGVLHGLDTMTTAKARFLDTFERLILAPRDLAYRVQFTGPTGTNAVEAALKLARLVTGRQSVIGFTNAFHGMTLGSLALTGSRSSRAAAGVTRQGVHIHPYDGYGGLDIDSITLLNQMLGDPSSGVDPPAAVLVETVQAEGGVNLAGPEWLRRLDEVSRRHGSLLIVDDIHVGCGRTGPFFSYETAGIEPDIVCLSKSLSGIGLPMALVLVKPELDKWQPGQHNGTFRGNNLAFVTARCALETYWADDALTGAVAVRAEQFGHRLAALAQRHPDVVGEVRGRGMILGIEMLNPELADAVSRIGFGNGLILELCGPNDEVVKLLPPLVISAAEVDEAMDRLDDTLEVVTTERSSLVA